jgi:hypothetical protein
MRREFIVALRNDAHQLLVLESSASLPVFPWGVLTELPQAKVISQKVRDDTGFLIGGLHLSSVGKDRPQIEVYRYTAHVDGGTPLSFPTEGFQSASWVAPSLVPKLMGASKDMVELVRDLNWTHTRDPHRP